MSENHLWSGRFGREPSLDAHQFSSSLSYDVVLWREDIKATTAHCEGLVMAGILNDSELKQIIETLDEAAGLLSAEAFSFSEVDEDIHSAIERFLIERLGDVGAKIHAGRSRNDLVVTDLRLWLKRQIPQIARGIHDLQEAIARQAHQNVEAIAPGYTHLQRAQPILLAHHLMAHAFALARDFERLIAAYRRTDVSPLGAAAFAGTTLPIDPTETARRMGFSRVFDNAADAVADRDFVLEFLSVASIAAMHISRLSEEIVLWTTSEFGFATLDDSYATGSSIMPNKKNPDVAELGRAKASRIAANFQHLLGVMKGLPLTYNRDLQEDKEPLFDTVTTLRGVLKSMKGAVQTLQFHHEVMRAAVVSSFAGATDLAEFLVTRGVPFRQAHTAVGNLVMKVEREGRTLTSLTVEDLQSVDPSFDETALALLDPVNSIAARSSHGGTSRDRVMDQFTKLELILDDQRRWIETFDISE